MATTMDGEFERIPDDETVKAGNAEPEPGLYRSESFFQDLEAFAHFFAFPDGGRTWVLTSDGPRIRRFRCPPWLKANSRGFRMTIPWALEKLCGNVRNAECTKLS